MSTSRDSTTSTNLKEQLQRLKQQPTSSADMAARLDD